ncbi:hypothetical protein RJT34_03827 [Clitoria ternatea]|uniref:Uncharacterized protein n=1 Tax=Clitoria ternatea TaxID=43366 RepID=A0AAN9Q2V3_CLITE
MISRGRKRVVLLRRVVLLLLPPLRNLFFLILVCDFFERDLFSILRLEGNVFGVRLKDIDSREFVSHLLIRAPESSSPTDSVPLPLRSSLLCLFSFFAAVQFLTPSDGTLIVSDRTLVTGGRKHLQVCEEGFNPISDWYCSGQECHWQQNPLHSQSSQFCFLLSIANF